MSLPTRAGAPSASTQQQQQLPSRSTPSPDAQPSSSLRSHEQQPTTPPPASTSSSTPSASGVQRSKALTGKARPRSSLPASQLAALSAAAAVVVGTGVWAALKLLRRKPGQQTSSVDKAKTTPGAATKGPCSGMKATSKSVPLADGSACVVRRAIPPDNSCLFNAVGYAMHHSKTKASFLRGVVAREVSSDPQEYSAAFLGMSNVEYCSWIMNRVNWGGGIEISILAKHYAREISAWNIESAREHTFGEEAGYPKQVMLIYNGVHYDSLAISPGPRAPETEDTTEFNPRTKRGKMIRAAAQKLVELTHKGKKFVAGSKSSSTKLKCGDCQKVFNGPLEAGKHREMTGHVHFEEVKR